MIELLVVISIIALLIALLLPALGAAQRATRNAKCLVNEKQVATAWFSFAADRDGRAVSHHEVGIAWPLQLQSYYNADEIITCPIAPTPKVTTEGASGFYGQPGDGTTAWTLVRHWYSHDEFRSGWKYWGGYGLNGWFDVRPGDKYRYLMIPNVDANVPTSTTPVVGDCSTRKGTPLETDTVPNPPVKVYNSAPADNITRFSIDRHQKAINMVFMDGSGRAVPVERETLLNSLTWHIEWDPVR